jgi:4-hydroxy-tetrahydrodipicolinate synthase
MIAHIGAPSTRLVLDHAESIVDIGVDALSLVPPYYIPHSQSELIDHIRTVSQAMGQPLFLYHVPSMCKQSLTYDNIVKLAEEKILVGLKDSAGDIKSFGELVGKTSTLDFCCLNGNSINLGRGFLLGAHGFVGAIANILPARCKEAHNASLSGDDAALEASQRFITKFFHVLNDYPTKATFTWLAKWVLKELGVIQHDTVFQPFERLDASGERYLRSNLMPLLQETRPVKASA